KRNPVGAENLSGLARVVRTNALAAMEDIALWHERDISHSSVERIIIPDSTILVDYMLNRLTSMLRNMHIYPERMKANMDRSYGLFNSQRVMLALTEKGLTREEAYALVQANAMKSWADAESFLGLLLADKEIAKHLSADELNCIFNMSYYLRNIDYVFKRAFD
ncbi:MAG: adenylosuccinate lyase, partial [Nitrospiraceae bacterium]|nr:adenylosuccinate lyase [Nitrospiraceae bacterium]